MLGTGTAFVTGFTIPNTGRFEVDCLGGSTNHRFRNTTGSDATVWIERGEPDTVFATVPPGTADGVTSTSDAQLVFWFIRTGGPAGPQTEVQVASRVSGAECFIQFVSLRVTH